MGLDLTMWAPRWVKRAGRVPLQPLIHRLDRLNDAVDALTKQVTILRETHLVQRQLLTDLLSSANAGEAYRLALRAVGVLNYENDTVSGERRFLTRYLSIYPSATIFDVGANSGRYSALARELAPTATIHAFEPHPASFKKLSELAATLNIYAHPIALGETTCEIDFYDYADDQGSEHASVYRDVIEGIHRRPATETRVRCETLDSVVQERGFERINLLKIDTEGHELAVLKGAHELLHQGRIDVVQFEFNAMNIISRVYMKDFFEVLNNYRIYRLLEKGVIEFAVYDPTFMEVFAYQNFGCIRRDLDPSWIHGN